MGENQCQLSSPILRSKETATSKQIENRNSIPPSFPPKSRGTVTVKEGLDMCSYRPQALKTVQALTRAKKERSIRTAGTSSCTRGIICGSGLPREEVHSTSSQTASEASSKVSVDFRPSMAALVKATFLVEAASQDLQGMRRCIHHFLLHLPSPLRPDCRPVAAHFLHHTPAQDLVFLLLGM
ncbi:MAG: hypothetical protein FRX49_08315 [Trebouxia sp. A1-2]|nr:MAG: hypothetical protein FRX49_08315 [Trebouxia sp. A1-2]